MSNSIDTRAGIPAYAELRALSNFSFLKGASWPEELVGRAKALGYGAIAVCDECSMAGAVRAHVASKEHDLKVLHGSQFQVVCDAPFTLVVIARNIEGYGNLCEFITSLRRSAEKGTYRLELGAIEPSALADCVVLVSPDRESTDAQLET
ncbi:PHP domain-containing protein, partial [Acinetobacter baumannii]|nr:PHP domain-containing protein [Acinetobacter baumannii]